MKNNTVRLEVDESKLVNNLRHAFTRRSNVLSELMQNARRAGATEIRFSISNGSITIDDNGSGIDDFSELLTVASSGWDAETIQKENPFGLGFLAALYSCQSINIQSNGTLLEADTTSVLNQDLISLSHSLVRVGTSITLFGLDYNFDELEGDIRNLSKGFPISVFIHDEELPRPHAKEALNGVDTNIGFIHLTGIHDGDHKPVSKTLVYLQGLPIQYNGRAINRKYFLTPFSKAVNDSRHNIVHLDSEKYLARVPDRDVLIEPDTMEEELSFIVSDKFWKHINQEKKDLSDHSFIEKWWGFAFEPHYGNHRTEKDHNFKVLFNDVYAVPGDLFFDVHDYPYALKNDEDIDYTSTADGTLNKSQLEKMTLLAVGELTDMYQYSQSNVIAYMFSFFSDDSQVYLLPKSESDYWKLDKEHWLHTLIEDVDHNAIEDHFSFEFINKSKEASFSGNWIRDVDVYFVESCTVTHLKSGKKVVIGDAFVLPDNTIVYPTSEESCFVVQQLITWVEDEQWALDKAEEEETLFSRFVLSERSENPIALLNQLLQAANAGRYSVLRDSSHQISIDKDGEIAINQVD